MRIVVDQRSPALQLITLALGFVAAVTGCSNGDVTFPPLPGAPDPGPYPTTVSVLPARATVEVGGTVTFLAVESAGARLQWMRNGVDIPGATKDTYSVVDAKASDDGATIGVRATNYGTAAATAVLMVSPYPAVVFEDTEFPASNWVATGVSIPPGGPAQSASQSLDGGNPGAYLRVVSNLPAGPSDTSVARASRSSVYDLAVLGAIYTVDIAAECTYWFEYTTPSEASIAVMAEQAGRTYATRSAPCGAWANYFFRDRSLDSLSATGFTQIAGPPCASSEACPDFGPSGAPIRFGLVTSARVTVGNPAATVAQGIDNWKVRVWRR